MGAAPLGRSLGRWMDRLEQQLDLEPLMLGCCKALTEAAQADRCSIMVLDVDTDQLAVRWASGARVKKPKGGTLRFRMGEGLAGWVAQSRKAYVSTDVGQEPRFVPYRKTTPSFRPIKAYCCLPLIAEGRTVGVVNLSSFSATKHAFPWFRGKAGKRFLDRLARVILQAALLREAEAVSRRWKRQAKAASETVAHLSHEIRTPLALVSEAAQQLMEGFGGELTQDQDHRVRMIRTQAERMLQLVGELLDLSRIESGRLPLHLERVFLQKVIREVAARYEILVSPRKMELDLGAEAAVYGDPSRLGQVVENLLTNAVKFTPPSGRISIRLAGKGESAEISVADTGVGISKSDQKKLFERFSQVRSAQMTAARGTGLGLAIVKEIAQLHGGSVKVSSQEGKGTVFTVSLPLYSPERVLTEEFRRLREQASREGQALAVQLLQSREGKPVSLEKVAALLKGRVAREDRILEKPGVGLVLLSVMAPETLPRLRQRLMEELSRHPEVAAIGDLQWGWALIPREETALQGVLDLAARRARGERSEMEPNAGGGP